MHKTKNLNRENVTRFVSHEYRNIEFEQMLQDISSKASISPVLVRKYSEKALKEWEKESGTDVLTLFTTTPSKRSGEIKKMLCNLKDHLRPIVFSSKKLDGVMDIATKSLEAMYRIY